MIPYIYDTRDVESLLPGVWHRDFWIDGPKRKERTDPDMPKGGKKDPRRAYDHIDGCIDVKRAWEKANLTLRQRQAVILRYGFDEQLGEIGAILGVTRQSATESLERGVEIITDWLNGKGRTKAPARLKEAA